MSSIQLNDPFTGEWISFLETVTWHDGSTMTDNKCDGVIFIKHNGLYYKRSVEGPINVKWFGVKGDGTTDDTYNFKKAMQTVYDLSKPLSPILGWRNPKKIFIPSGEYLITANIIDATVDSGRFVFQGDGWQNTEIIYQPTDSDEYMLENPGIIGFCTFEGIKFTTNNNGMFLNGIGGLSGNSQAFVFEKCFFQSWKQIIRASGATMMSEITFRECKIKDSDQSSILFSLENDQAVNWRFFSTDIESFKGVLFDFIEGQTIYYYQGSIIPFEGTVIRINSNADPNTFGGGTQPHISFWGPRFELHESAKLIQVLEERVNFVFKFDSCGMGGFKIEDGLPVIETKGKGTLIFDTCSNWNNYKFSHNVNDAEDYLSPLRIIFKNIAPSIDQFDQSVCNPLNNISAYPIYIFDNCNSNLWYRPWKKAAQNSPYGWVISKHVSGVNPNSDGVYLPSVSSGTTYKVDLLIPDQYIIDRKIIFKKASDIGGYYSQIHNIKIYDKAEAVLLAEGVFDTDKGLILEDLRGGLLHENDKYVIHITPDPLTFYGSDLIIGINLISEY